ncbi:hypothetical protein GN958_ATG00700 [Phytophthora infestans]|uniref:Ankyrin repeat protein n=1 Tax=Phytophthora infestans TaxID=4787 RepID=A0A8S9VF34_PHYIN|nr:hypothetical protein GN958_ATG00700 [Phytophthora infestans]
MNAAATGGHLKILEWLRDNCSDKCDVSTMNRATRSGCVDVVKWINENYTIDKLSSFVKLRWATWKLSNGYTNTNVRVLLLRWMEMLVLDIRR